MPAAALSFAPASPPPDSLSLASLADSKVSNFQKILKKQKFQKNIKFSKILKFRKNIKFRKKQKIMKFPK